ncbi:flippase [Bradyrhizobium sp. B117]|uniref:flippase n=1 Tax=Bradyrhizobium sp. B117 TaxID=3140246 RepID=UPI0031845989
MFHNLWGVALPLIAALVTVPPYLRALGEERYGILSLIWVLFGYFGLFDFGLSRSTANRLAKIGEGEPERREIIFKTSLLMNLALGLIGAFSFAIVSHLTLTFIVKGSESFHIEILHALPLAALLLPITLVGNTFVGRLQAEERFYALNGIQSFGAVAMQLLPLGFIYLVHISLSVAMLGCLVARSLWVFALFLTVARTKHPGRASFAPAEAKELIKYGAWLTVTNVVGPILVSLDQFMIAYVLGSGAVARYSIPFNFAQKATILPGAVTQALFPRLSSLSGAEAQEMANRSLVAVGGIMALICAPAILLADFGLSLWISPEFAHAASNVARTILFGIWINGLAYIPSCLLQAQGRVDITARFHVIELVPFVLILFVLLHFFGLQGAAFAWVIRVSIDAALLFGVTSFGRATALGLLPSGALMAVAWLGALWAQPTTLVALSLALTCSVVAVGSLLLTTPYARQALHLLLPGRATH